MQQPEEFPLQSPTPPPPTNVWQKRVEQLFVRYSWLLDQSADLFGQPDQWSSHVDSAEDCVREFQSLYDELQAVPGFVEAANGGAYIQSVLGWLSETFLPNARSADAAQVEELAEPPPVPFQVEPIEDQQWLEQEIEFTSSLLSQIEQCGVAKGDLATDPLLGPTVLQFQQRYDALLERVSANPPQEFLALQRRASVFDLEQFPVADGLDEESSSTSDSDEADSQATLALIAEARSLSAVAVVFSVAPVTEESIAAAQHLHGQAVVCERNLAGCIVQGVDFNQIRDIFSSVMNADVPRAVEVEVQEINLIDQTVMGPRHLLQLLRCLGVVQEIRESREIRPVQFPATNSLRAALTRLIINCLGERRAWQLGLAARAALFPTTAAVTVPQSVALPRELAAHYHRAEQSAARLREVIRPMFSPQLVMSLGRVSNLALGALFLLLINRVAANTSSDALFDLMQASSALREFLLSFGAPFINSLSALVALPVSFRQVLQTEQGYRAAVLGLSGYTMASALDEVNRLYQRWSEIELSSEQTSIVEQSARMGRPLSSLLWLGGLSYQFYQGLNHFNSVSEQMSEIVVGSANSSCPTMEFGFFPDVTVQFFCALELFMSEFEDPLMQLATGLLIYAAIQVALSVVPVAERAFLNALDAESFADFLLAGPRAVFALRYNDPNLTTAQVERAVTCDQSTGRILLTLPAVESRVGEEAVVHVDDQYDEEAALRVVDEMDEGCDEEEVLPDQEAVLHDEREEQGVRDCSM